MIKMNNETILDMAVSGTTVVQDTISSFMGFDKYAKQKRVEKVCKIIIGLLKINKVVDIATLIKESGESADIVLDAFNKLKNEGRIIEH